MSRKGFWTSMAVIMAVIIALAGLEISLGNQKTWDCEHPFVNTQISWEQTFRAGSWED